MSAWSIGAGRGAFSTKAGKPNKAVEFIGRFTKWIPGDVIVLYGGTVALMQPEQPAEGSVTPVVSVPAWLITLIATPLIVWVAAGLADKKQIPWRIAFSVPSFMIWSATVPHSAWEKWGVFSENAPIVYLVLGLLALILPPIADSVIDD